MPLPRLTGSQPPPHSSHGGSGICSVCGATFRLVPATGTLWKHGHADGNPPCPGSWCLPSARPPSTLDASLDLFVDSPPPISVGQSSCLSTTGTDFNLSELLRPSLRRIPKGVRFKAASLLDNLLRSLNSLPEDLDRWRALLDFGKCLSTPPRGGG